MENPMQLLGYYALCTESPAVASVISDMQVGKSWGAVDRQQPT